MIDLAARAPALAVNRAELLCLVAYAVVAQLIGLGLGYFFWHLSNKRPPAGVDDCSHSDQVTT